MGKLGAVRIAQGIAALGWGVALSAAGPAWAGGCPALGWAEGLGQFQEASAAFPTKDTPVNAVDCNFHQWSWEAFVWATALDANGVPRFMGLQTPGDLFTGTAGKPRTGPLKLAARSSTPHGMAGFVEGAGAIVEADGNMLVGTVQIGTEVVITVNVGPTKGVIPTVKGLDKDEAVRVLNDNGFAKVEFATLVLDEAQAIKNPATQRAQAVRALQAQFRIATTGTPRPETSSTIFTTSVA